MDLMWNKRTSWCNDNGISPYSELFWNVSVIGVEENLDFIGVVEKYSSANISLIAKEILERREENAIELANEFEDLI